MMVEDRGADLISRFPDSGSFLTFLEENLLPNRPCVFGESFTRGWRARQEWRNVGDTPNMDFLEDCFGHAIVPVADCSRVEFSTHHKTEMTLKEYAHWWRSKGKSGTLYLKDWHFTKDFPNYKAYTVLDFFKSDWLNEVWSARLDVSDDYRFVYIGPKGTWTPFHADVFRSYSWSANVCGCKEWLLFPPGEEELLKDKFGYLPFDVTSRELENKELYPNAHKSRGPIRVVQRSGEIIFVPSGWHHQVRNTEDTLSINHNWTNSCGIGYMWSHLQNELALVKRELEDCRSMDSWEEQCQVVLKASAGMDYWEFVQLLSIVALSRLNQLKQIIPPTSKLCEGFLSLHTLIQETLSNPSKTVKFLESASEFENAKNGDGMDLVLSSLKCVGESQNLTERLLNCHIQKLFIEESPNIGEDKTLLVFFRLYELCTLCTLIPNVIMLSS